MNVDPAVHALLVDPATHGQVGERVEVVETHAAAVYLARSLAYKLKKPVKLDYLDFSTPERRRRVCERELALNQPVAPGLYLGLSRIVRGSGGLALDGDGEEIEVAVRMRRFPQDDLFSARADRGALGLDAMEPLARAVRALHARAPVVRCDDAAADLRAVLAGNAAAFAHQGDVLGPGTGAVIDACGQALDAARDTLVARGRSGYVRRAHGDLHLGNVVWLDGEAVPFDALEFSEAFATVDVLYDLAFLWMDLVSRGLVAHAARLLDLVLQGCAPDDLDGLIAWGALVSLRAQIRAKVDADRAAEMGDGPARDAVVAHARAMLALAGDALTPRAPRLIAVGGLSGSGKSTLAASIAGALGALVLRSDVERKALAGIPPTERLPDSAYTPDASAAVYARLDAKAERALRAGFSVVLDAVHARPAERARARGLAERLEVPFTGLWLDASPEVLRERVDARTGDPSDADRQVVDRQLGFELGPIDWARVPADGSPERALAAARAVLAG